MEMEFFAKINEAYQIGINIPNNKKAIDIITRSDLKNSEIDLKCKNDTVDKNLVKGVK